MIFSPPNPTDSTPAPRRPWIIGHRGASDAAPENTRSAIEAALDTGCDGIEFDVQLTRDCIPVLYHDRTLYKISGQLKRLSTVDFDYLEKLDWGKWFSAEFTGERLLSLADLLQDYAARTRLFMEIKSRSSDRPSGHHLKLTEIVVDMVHTLVAPEFHQDLFVLSFDREVLERAHRLEPEWSYVWNVDNDDAMGMPEFVSAICVPVKHITPQLVQEMHRLDKRVMTYTCNTPRQTDTATDAGVDGLMSDRPAWLMEYLSY